MKTPNTLTKSAPNSWSRMAPLAWIAAISCQPRPAAGEAIHPTTPRYAPAGVEAVSLPPAPTMLPLAGPTVMPEDPDATASALLAEEKAAAALAPENGGDEAAASNMRMFPGGLGVEDLRVGSGPEVQAGRQVSVHYVGRLPDGTVFDSSRKRTTPLRYEFGAGRMIKGWEEGMVGMRVGGLRRLLIPPHKAYGERGRPGTIPPNSVLEFEVEMLKMQ